MSATPSKERRAHPRRPLNTSVELFHGPTRRKFPARCVDVSLSGLLMKVPAATPVQPGQSIRLGLAGPARPEYGPLGCQPRDATVVRVDRHRLLSDGHVAVGVRFAEV